MSARRLVALTYAMLVERLDRDGRERFDALLEDGPALEQPDMAALLAFGMEMG